MRLKLLYEKGREIEMIVKTYMKNELKNMVFEVPDLEVDVLLSYLSDWICDFIINNRDET